MNKKNLLLGSAIAGMLLAVPTSASAMFPDTENHWANEEVNRLVDLGIINGFPNGTFRPSDDVTRGQFMAFVSRSVDLPEPSKDITLTDVHQNLSLYEEIARAYQAGILRGTVSGESQHNHAVTRADVVTLLHRTLMHLAEEGLLEHNDNVSEPSTDAFRFQDDSLPAYAQEAIYTLHNLGVVQGDLDGYFNPDSPASRVHSAVFIDRFLTVLEEDFGYVKERSTDDDDDENNENGDEGNGNDDPTDEWMEHLDKLKEDPENVTFDELSQMSYDDMTYVFGEFRRYTRSPALGMSGFQMRVLDRVQTLYTQTQRYLEDDTGRVMPPRKPYTSYMDTSDLGGMLRSYPVLSIGVNNHMLTDVIETEGDRYLNKTYPFFADPAEYVRLLEKEPVVQDNLKAQERRDNIFNETEVLYKELLEVKERTPEEGKTLVQLDVHAPSFPVFRHDAFEIHEYKLGIVPLDGYYDRRYPNYWENGDLFFDVEDVFQYIVDGDVQIDGDDIFITHDGDTFTFTEGETTVLKNGEPVEELFDPIVRTVYERRRSEGTFERLYGGVRQIADTLGLHTKLMAFGEYNLFNDHSILYLSDYDMGMDYIPVSEDLVSEINGGNEFIASSDIGYDVYLKRIAERKDN